jgi:hypothetical protein
VPGSYVSSKLRQGDKFARVFGYADRTTWQGSWAATRRGLTSARPASTASTTRSRPPTAAPSPSAGLCIFINSTEVRVVGEHVGQVLTNAHCRADRARQRQPEPGALLHHPGRRLGRWLVGRQRAAFQTQACGAPAWAR